MTFKNFILERASFILKPITDIHQLLKDKGYGDVIKKSKYTVIIRTGEDRIALMDKLLKDLAEYNPVYQVDRKHSSIGYITVPPKFTIIVKPQKVSFSPGEENEKIVSKIINDYIQLSQAPITVVFNSGKTSFECTNVQKSFDNKFQKKGIKADIILTGNQEYRFSLKKDDATRWASIDRFFNNNHKILKEIKELDQENKIKLSFYEGLYSISRPLYFDCPEDYKHYFLFGNDIRPDNGAIIVKTFKESDFVFDDANNLLTINCSAIYNSIEDIPKNKEPLILVTTPLVRRNVRSIMPGFRFEAVTKEYIAAKNALPITGLF